LKLKLNSNFVIEPSLLYTRGFDNEGYESTNYKAQCLWLLFKYSTVGQINHYTFYLFYVVVSHNMTSYCSKVNK